MKRISSSDLPFETALVSQLFAHTHSVSIADITKFFKSLGLPTSVPGVWNRTSFWISNGLVLKVGHRFFSADYVSGHIVQPLSAEVDHERK